jgi:hypothetical protein
MRATGTTPPTHGGWLSAMFGWAMLSIFIRYEEIQIIGAVLNQ